MVGVKEEEEDEQQGRITEIVGREPCKDAMERLGEEDERQRLFDYLEIR